MKKEVPFRFNLQELGGALGDLGTLLPLMVALILVNGLDPLPVFVLVGLFYIGAGLYYRVPTPVQPLKAVAALAISFGLSASVIGAAGLIMVIILIALSLTNLISTVVKLFPRSVVRGIQLSIGLILLRRGVELALGQRLFINSASGPPGLAQVPVGAFLAVAALLIFILCHFVLFRRGRQFPASLAVLVFGLGSGAAFGYVPAVDGLGAAIPSMALPGMADLWTALTILVIPQLPLTLGNAVVGTWDTSRVYFGEKAHRVKPRALATSMGLANIAAGLFGAMPMCHGSGGLTAHYKLGARTGAANLMIGSLVLIAGLILGSAAVSLFSAIPLAVLGTLLAIVGTYHALLVRDVKSRNELAVAATVAVITLSLGNLAFGFGAGILLHHILRLDISRVYRRLLQMAGHWPGSQNRHADESAGGLQYIKARRQ